MLQARRRDMIGTAVAILQDGIARGEFPGWIEIGPLAAGFAALLDGIRLQAVEEGAGYRRAEAERRVTAMLELVFAAAATGRPARLVPAAPRPYVSPRAPTSATATAPEAPAAGPTRAAAAS